MSTLVTKFGETSVERRESVGVGDSAMTPVTDDLISDRDSHQEPLSWSLIVKETDADEVIRRIYKEVIINGR